MLQSIEITGFRKYHYFQLEGLNQINFILGENNIGKTSILEAIFAWACGQNVQPFLYIPLSRGRYSNQNPFWVIEEILACSNDRKQLPLKIKFEGNYNGKIESFEHTIVPSDLLTEYDSYYRSDMDHILTRSDRLSAEEALTVYRGIPGVIPANSTMVAQWTVVHDGNPISTNIFVPQIPMPGIEPFCQAKYIDILSQTSVGENVKMYSSLKREGLLAELTQEMCTIFPEIDGFDMIPYPDGSQAPVSVLRKDGTYLPLYAFGDGVQKWFYLFGAMTLYKNSIICIDEIDAGFHPQAQTDFCKHLIKSAIKNNVQLFITTHNIEFIDNFLSAIQNISREKSEQIRLITLKNDADKTVTRNIGANEALRSRDLYNLELR